MNATDMDRFRELMERFSLNAEPEPCLNGHCVTVEEDHGYEINFYFDDDGKFVAVGLVG